MLQGNIGRSGSLPRTTTVSTLAKRSTWAWTCDETAAFDGPGRWSSQDEDTHHSPRSPRYGRLDAINTSPRYAGPRGAKQPPASPSIRMDLSLSRPLTSPTHETPPLRSLCSSSPYPYALRYRTSHSPPPTDPCSKPLLK